MFDPGYKLSYFWEGLSKYEESHLKLVERDDNLFKSLKRWYKRDFFHIEMLIPFCQDCFSKFVIKMDLKDESFILILKELLRPKFKCISV
ncbi:hypothetical protein JCM15415_11130 [Methanobacterium movens]|nr:MAG: hypothetical protein CIT03_01115 [Methanobacterium sp.]